MAIFIKNLVLAQQLLIFAGKLLNKNWYHGTSHKFSGFDLSQAGLRDYGDFGYGVYLTPNARLAASYARDSAKGSDRDAQVLVVRVRAANTADFDDSSFQASVMAATGVPFPKVLVPGQKQTRPKEDAELITKYMLDNGYDSAVARGGMELVVYSPKIIDIDRAVSLEDAAYLP